MEFLFSNTAGADNKASLSARDGRRRSLVLLGRVFVIALFTSSAPVAAAESRYDNLVDINSFHTWGVAVDATLVDEKDHEVAMPTAFDEFTPAAKLRYQGGDAPRRFLRKAQRVVAFRRL